jgi:hypothetical protein
MKTLSWFFVLVKMYLKHEHIRLSSIANIISITDSEEHDSEAKHEKVKNETGKMYLIKN